MSDRNLRPRAHGDFTGQIFRRQAMEKIKREEEEKKSQQVDAEFFREAERQAIHVGEVVDFEETRTG